MNKLESYIELITSVRNVRSEMNVPPSRKAKLFIATQSKESFGEETFDFFKALVRILLFDNRNLII